ncbi:MAG: Nif3-like dinuclear metal center hexameric protein [Peptoniphilus sp.]|nr:Nif3-like dinuclear metal center hexameric protein [Peptoniphilus sp.]MDD7362730.1 Nif3-like dinuclear metal center hexameric protein [Bacillota bacterium]MDY6044576.1 Nif3-like dinuclear metal center hexameric protein [Peptoniphilus sp.]
MNSTEIVDKLCEWAPESLQESWDKTGWQLRLEDRTVENVVVAMDVTEDVVDLAIEAGAELILTHHPFFFSPLEAVDETSVKGAMVCALIRHGISVYSTHTAMDKAKGGVNDQWIDKLGLSGVRTLSEEDELGLIGRSAKTLDELKRIFEDEEITGIRCYGRKKDVVETIAFVGGSGADYIEDAARAGADVLITGDVKHHDGQRAYERGLMVIDIGHFHSEKAILEAMAEWVEEIAGATAHVIMNSPFVFEI